MKNTTLEYSPTWINTYLKFPLYFYYEKVRGCSETIAKSQEDRFNAGKAVHLAVKKLIKSHERDQARTALSRAWRVWGLDKTEYDMNQAFLSAETCYNSLGLIRPDQRDLVKAEFELKQRIPFQDYNIRYTGTVDCVDERESLTITDWKTGHYRPELTEDYKNQVLFYAGLFLEEHGRAPVEFRVFYPDEKDERSQKKGLLNKWFSSVSEIKGNMQRINKLVIEIEDKIQEGLGPDDWAHSRQGELQFPEYSNYEKARQEREELGVNG